MGGEIPLLSNLHLTKNRRGSKEPVLFLMAVRMQIKPIHRVIILAITLSLLAGGCAALRPVRSLAYSETSLFLLPPLGCRRLRRQNRPISEFG